MLRVWVIGISLHRYWGCSFGFRDLSLLAIPLYRVQILGKRQYFSPDISRQRQTDRQTTKIELRVGRVYKNRICGRDLDAYRKAQPGEFIREAAK